MSLHCHRPKSGEPDEENYAAWELGDMDKNRPQDHLVRSVSAQGGPCACLGVCKTAETKEHVPCQHTEDPMGICGSMYLR